MTDYTRQVQAACSAADAFVALTDHIDHWWSRDFDGRADAVGQEFTVRFGRTFKTFRVVELEPDSKVVWLCVASHLDLDGLKTKSEWDATRVEWTLQHMGGVTIIEVSHFGLTPALGCHGACEQGWDHFLEHSLVPFLETGTGRPSEGVVAPGALESAT